MDQKDLSHAMAIVVQSMIQGHPTKILRLVKNTFCAIFIYHSDQTQTFDLEDNEVRVHPLCQNHRYRQTKQIAYGLLCACYQRHIFSLFFLLWPLTVLIKQTRQAVLAVKQSILLRCLWLECTLTIIERASCGCLLPGGSMISVVQFLFCEK